MDRFLNNLKRLSFDVIALITLIVLILFIPSEYVSVNIFGLVVTKFILVSAAIIHAHITRRLLFPYINFSKETDLSNNIMVIAWYVIIIFAWSRGG